MAGSQRIAAVLVSVGLLVVLAIVAESSAAGVCNPNALYPCLPAIEGAHPPAPSWQCCNVVKSVDKNCMCNQLTPSSFPAQMVNNGLHLPKKCGRMDLRGFHCRQLKAREESPKRTSGHTHSSYPIAGSTVYDIK